MWTTPGGGFWLVSGNLVTKTCHKVAGPKPPRPLKPGRGGGVPEGEEGRGTLHTFIERTGLDTVRLSVNAEVSENQHGVKAVAGHLGAVA